MEATRCLSEPKGPSSELISAIVTVEASQSARSLSAAVKVLARQFSADREVVSRFMSEARVVITIRHGNIIDVFSFVALSDGRRYFVMELLKGLPFNVYLNEVGPLQPAQVVAIMSGLPRHWTPPTQRAQLAI